MLFNKIIESFLTSNKNDKHYSNHLIAASSSVCKVHQNDEASQQEDEQFILYQVQFCKTAKCENTRIT